MIIGYTKKQQPITRIVIAIIFLFIFFEIPFEPNNNTVTDEIPFTVLH